MAVQTNNSRMAIVRETTEGTPVAPSSGANYIALQEGFSLEPSFNELENAELSGSIGTAKSVLGLEEPSASISHYIRHSGVEGQEPNFGLLLEGAFAAKTVNATEYDLVAGSTAGTASARAVVNVDVGEGAQFERGQALLLKDGVNGYSLRNVYSIATDALSLNFNLPGAPASGVNLGKAILYKPSSTVAHPSFTVWSYRGNGGAVEMIAGSKVTEMSVEIQAGEFINGSFSMEGVSYYFDPITLTATDTKLDFTDDDGTWAATIAAGTYKDPHQLAAAIQAAMRSANSGETATVTYSNTTGKFTIKTTGTVLSLLWNTGGNAANTIGDKIGFSTAADDTGVAATTGYTSDNAISLVSPHTPTFDSSDPLVAKNNEVFIGDFYDTTSFCASSVTMNLSNTLAKVECVNAVSGVDSSLMTKREVTIDVVGTLSAYEADKFSRFRQGTTTQFLYNFGVKTGTNWTAGYCGNIYVPTATITSFTLGDNDGIVTLEMTLKAFVASGAGEVYLNFV